MRGRPFPLIGALLVVIPLLLAGCGSGADDTGFKHCGDGNLDGDEECDDGNLSDSDGCLSTCTFNVCGDGFVNQGVEQCEQGLFGEATCASLGFASGTLACSPQCTFDTSGCTGTPPSPTATPVPTATTSGVATPTAAGTPTPTPASTPSGGCQAGDQLIVVASLDTAYGAALIELAYPASANIPGTASAQSVADRVTFASTGGITTVNDEDKSGGDGVDDTLTASFVSFSDHPAGTFVTVTFDCVAGQAAPAAGDFHCTVVSASTAGGVPIAGVVCSIVVQ